MKNPYTAKSRGLPGDLSAMGTLVIVLLLLPACSSREADAPGTGDPVVATHMPPGRPVTVTVHPGEPDGELDERYLGFALDTAQFTGGRWWKQGADSRQPVETPDLESLKLRKLVSYLAPSRMRVGGTDCDGAYFCPEEGDCELPDRYREAFRDEEDRQATFFTHEDIRRIADFASTVGTEVMFCLNVGPGPRDPRTGLWTPDNAELLVRYATSLPGGDCFRVWEPGNEVNFLSFHFHTPKDVTPDLFAEDLKTFRALVDRAAPGGRVAAPGCYFLPFPALGDVNFTARLMELAGDSVDLLTWHLYATQSDRCWAVPFPCTRENLFKESIVENHRAQARYVAAAAGGLPVMNGESASGQCGGQAGVSDTLLDALWYADWIGIMAQEGTGAVVRQTLVGSEYGMLHPGTFEPRPTFLANVLYRRLVEKFRLKTIGDRASIKAHGFCGTGGGTVTAVLSNPGPEALAVELVAEGTAVAGARQWTLATGGDPAAVRATIERSGTAEDGTIPDPPGTVVHREQGRAYADVAPYSLVFVNLALETPSPVCR